MPSLWHLGYQIRSEDYSQKEVFTRGDVKEFLQLTDEEMNDIEQRIKEDKEKGAI